MVSKAIHVAVAVIIHPDTGRVFITQRPEHVHQGGLWEFPGGKVEMGESVFAALQRELWEETGIHIESARPLIRIPYVYPDKMVLLDVHRILRWQGEPHGREGQASAWVAPETMIVDAFPAADKPIITALRLPALYLITPKPELDHTVFLTRLEKCVSAGVQLVQLRAKALDEQTLYRLGKHAVGICHAHGAKLLLNGQPEMAEAIGADGVHLTSRQLLLLSDRPKNRWVAASCHNAQELQRAQTLDIDFVVLSPVNRTASHPEATPLGWESFASLIENIALPVYALGGMTPADMTMAWQHGGQGVGVMRGVWDDEDKFQLSGDTII